MVFLVLQLFDFVPELFFLFFILLLLPGYLIFNSLQFLHIYGLFLYLCVELLLFELH